MVDVGADAHFGQPDDFVRVPRIWRAAAGDDGDGDAVGGEATLRFGDETRRRRRARVGHQPIEAQTVRRNGGTRKIKRLINGDDTGALVTAVEFHQHANLSPGYLSRPGGCIERQRIVHGDAHPHTPGKRRESKRLGGAEQRIGDQDIVQAGIRHDLGFAELLAGDAAGAEFHLPAREGWHLVGLDVRTQAQAVAIAIRLHLREVMLHAIEIDDGNGGIQILDAHHSASSSAAQHHDAVDLDLNADELAAHCGAGQRLLGEVTLRDRCSPWVRRPDRPAFPAGRFRRSRIVSRT